MAAVYAAQHTDTLEGLILLAAYSNTDLSHSSLRVLSLYGSEDGVLNYDKYRDNRPYLPEDTTEVVLQGGCHAYFGSYGAQRGDGHPTITPTEQIQQTVQHIMTWIQPPLQKAAVP